MGWTIGIGSTRSDVIRERTKNYESEAQRRECLAKAVRGNCLWTAWEITRKPGGEKQRYIGLDLLGTDGEGNWGYKDLEEGQGVSEVSCPLSFLDLVPEVAHAGWREAVRRRHARANQKLSVGQTIRLVNCSIPSITVTSVRPLRGTYMGREYNVARKFLPPPAEPEQQQQQPDARGDSGTQTALFAA
ncbi:MAG: hypothetical protein ACJ74Q_15545 [Pyrinomonadaceae bacterium]